MSGREQSLLDILKANVGLSEEEFVVKNPEPVLVTPFRASSSDSLRVAQAADSASSFSENMYAAYKNSIVYRVSAFGTHAFKGMLYVLGSADSCDIVVAGQGVASSHAMLRKGSDSWMVKNAGIGRETYVIDSARFGLETRLVEGEELALSDASRIRCGDVEVEFYTPVGFHAYLKNLDAMAKNPKAS